jgi:hypothetical protein
VTEIVRDKPKMKIKIVNVQNLGLRLERIKHDKSKIIGLKQLKKSWTEDKPSGLVEIHRKIRRDNSR